MTAKQRIDEVIKSLDSAVAKIADINGKLKAKLPICNECTKILSSDEVAERLENGLNVFGEDIVCDKCYAEWQAQKFAETKHPDER
jgi:uncharacterized protein with PIN domain